MEEFEDLAMLYINQVVKEAQKANDNNLSDYQIALIRKTESDRIIEAVKKNGIASIIVFIEERLKLKYHFKNQYI
jgi:nitrate reductase beta subunit